MGAKHVPRSPQNYRAGSTSQKTEEARNSFSQIGKEKFKTQIQKGKIWDI
jgi:hypothetical protein